MQDNDRFIKTYSQGILTNVTEIWVDVRTGVNYIFHSNGDGCGLTPLIDGNGKPVFTVIEKK